MQRKTRRPRRLLSSAIVAALAAAPLHAATITVTSADDGVSSTRCNLRAALAAIDAGSATGACAGSTGGTFGSDDTIRFAAALAGATVTLAQGQLAVHKPVTLNGSGQTIDANDLSRVLYVSASALTASDLTLTHGNASGGGAAAKAGGGISAVDGSSLALDHVRVAGNTSAGAGGGVYFSSGTGDLTLRSTQIENNTAAQPGGGLAFLGKTLTIESSVVSGNVGDRVGGLIVNLNKAGSDVAIVSSTLSGNRASCSADFCAGGMYVWSNRLLVRDTTISGNQASGQAQYLAGGAYVYGAVATFANSTIAANSATGVNYVVGGISELHGNGHAIAGTSAPQSGAGLTLINCTVSANAGAGSAPDGAVGGGVFSGVQKPTVTGFSGALASANSIISGNTPAGSDLYTQHLAAGTTLSAAYSLLGTAANASPLNEVANHNVFSDAPGLGPLQYNGGPTSTLAPAAGSPAVDAGSDALAQIARVPLSFDQRRTYARVYGAHVDIGAVESGATAERVFFDGFE